MVPALAIGVLAVAWRPSILRNGPAPLLDALTLAVLAAALLQTVPLSRPLLARLSPAAEAVERQIVLVDPGGLLPISIDLRSSAMAIGVFACVVLLYFTGREIFDRGGVRSTARGIALIGLVLSAVALAQDVSAHGLMYWRWRPLDDGPAPFGPFVNRNHFATWGVMAVPLCVGYLTAHATAHHGAGAMSSWRRKLVAAIDARGALLLAAVGLLIVAIAASLSRSGLIGLAAAVASGAVLARRRIGSTLTRSARPAIFMLTLGVLAGLAVLVRVGPAVIAGRFAASNIGLAHRLTIWQDTMAVLRDFWVTGTGVGTYQTAMIVYQRSGLGVLFNQAHNHYLQVVAEGGLLVGVPVLVALGAFAREARLALESDRSGLYWVRLGAICGLIGVAVQSLLETGLTTPANGALAAVLAAIATHLPVRVDKARLD